MKYGTASNRRGVIMERLRAEGFAAITALAKVLAVSEMTVRRDLVQLRDEGAVHLVHGGATLPVGARSSFGSRQGENAEAKRRIALRAAELVAPGDAIALDAGTTAYALADALPTGFAGCVVTPSIPAVQLLMERGGPRVVALGGEVHRASRACTGPLATDGAGQLRVRTFFLGVAAVDDRGVYVEADLERPTKLTLMAIAERVVLLADRSKTSRTAPVLLCPLAALSAWVTDAAPPSRLRGALREAQVEMRLAT